MRAQRMHWQEFRRYQDWRRWRYWKPEWWKRFVRDTVHYRKENRIDGEGAAAGINLLFDRKEQSRLDDWKEYQHWQYLRADRDVKGSESHASNQHIYSQEEPLQAPAEPTGPIEGTDPPQDFTVDPNAASWSGDDFGLRKRRALLKWVDEQVPLIAAKCRRSLIHTNGEPSPAPPVQMTGESSSSFFGKRKRPAKETDPPTKSRRRIAQAVGVSVEEDEMTTSPEQSTHLAMSEPTHLATPDPAALELLTSLNVQLAKSLGTWGTRAQAAAAPGSPPPLHSLSSRISEGGAQPRAKALPRAAHPSSGKRKQHSTVAKGKAPSSAKSQKSLLAEERKERQHHANTAPPLRKSARLREKDLKHLSE